MEANAKGKQSEDKMLTRSQDFSISSEGDFEDNIQNGRHTWAKKTEYVLSAIGYCVGLGNIWRFPYVCMRNGGGAFLIPFVISLFICALPVYFLEAAMGQFLGKSSWHAWCICPMFKGIGISMNMLSLMLTWYYSMILGWCLIYLFNSFKSPLPWMRCDGDWNTKACIAANKLYEESSTSTMLNASTTTAAMTALGGFNSSEVLTVFGNASSVIVNNVTNIAAGVGAGNVTEVVERVSSTKEFWLHNVLEITDGLHDLGGLPWHTAVSLVIANIVVLFGIIKGIHSSGKVVYITATLPYLLLTVMLILGCTLPGAGDGVIFYIYPDFSKLLTLQTWVEAAIQVFYSLGPAWGGLITMASYNKFKNNCMRDSILLTIACEGTSIFGGFAIFTILGHMAYNAKVPITDFAKSGPGLAFIVYPQAISYLPLPQLWGFLFFLMLFTLGLDSQFTNVETIITTLADVWPRFVSKWRKTISIGSMTGFTVCGLLFAARGGIYLFTLMDWYIAAFTLLPQAALECVIVAWIYGSDRFCSDIKLMIGRDVPRIFIWAWKFITPGLMMILFFITLAFYKPPSYENYLYPIEAEFGGWLFALAPFTAIIIVAVIQVKNQDGSLIQRIKRACQPTAEWAPALPEEREKYNNNVPAANDDFGITKV